MATTVREFQVTFDCADPGRVSRFWCDVLGYELPAPPPGFDSWEAFEDIRLEQFGASLVRVMPANEVDESCIVMQDVEGNEFCLD